MPLWIPRIKSVEEQIAEEQAKQWALQAKPQTLEIEPFMPTTPELPEWQPTVTEPVAEQPTITPRREFITTPMVATPTTIKAPAIPELKEEPISLPFWQRALQVFAAPFNWVDETIIKPGLALAGTAMGLVPEVVRQPGEDFWEWKKRSWAELKTPGFDINVPWSDEPWRIDVKGVLEFIPWLLIPGAGQVGTGTRAARGIAGFVGKVAKPLGYAVEYSPWGLVEKTAGVAMKAGVKAIGKGTEAVSTKIGERVFGKIPPEKVSPEVEKLSKFFEESIVPARQAFEKALPEFRGKQLGGLQALAKQLREGKINYEKYMELAEKQPATGGIRKGFAVKATDITEQDIVNLTNEIAQKVEEGALTKDLAFKLRDTIMGVDLPEPKEIVHFREVFGNRFAEAVKKLTTLPRSKSEGIIDVLNATRAVVSAVDVSMTFRQGLILVLTHPVAGARNFTRQLKAFASEKVALELDDKLRARPLYNNAIRDGVDFTAVRKGARLARKEEPYMSNIAQRLPMIRRSERAATVFLNEMRMSAYEAAYNAMTAQGATEAEMKLLGNFINLAAGRGKLPANLDRYAPLLNTILFSPKYQMSTLQLPRQIGRMLISKNPYMRKEAAKALVTFVGGGTALLGLLKATGVGDVKTDPRSGDFGKLIIGDTRIDIWRGYVQYLRFAGQMLTGERKSAYGNINKAERTDIAVRFLQSKFSPAAGLITDLVRGETFMGEDFLTSTKDVVRAARERLMPLAIQDVMDAMEQSGINGLWTAAPATLGIGVLTYVNEFVKAKNKVARQLGYDTWDEIDPKTQQEIENSNAELQAAYIQFDRQVMGTAWGDWRLAGNAVEDNFRVMVDQAVAQYRTSVDPNKGNIFREKIADAFVARRGGYDARNRMPQFEDIVRRLDTKDTAEALIGLGPEQLAIRTYMEALYGDDMYDEFGDYRFDEAQARKQQLHQQLGAEMFQYVEEYQALKFEDLPAEFQELAKAKVILRPYWQVADWAIRNFGKAWADSSRGQAFISRIRKQMRLTNPQIAMAYDRFYKSY